MDGSVVTDHSGCRSQPNLRAGIDLLLFAFGLVFLRTCILLVLVDHAVEMADSILKWSSIGAQNKSEYASLNFEYYLQFMVRNSLLSAKI